jgi:iron complex transport system substrate-binding protein
MRILSLAPNVTEILFAMGMGDRVVGRSNYCTVPAEALKVPAVGDTLSINLEKVISLKPTLALVVTKRPEVAATLEGVGIRTVMLKCDTMPELMETIQAIGRETQAGEASATLMAWIRENLEATRRRVEGRTRPKVLFAFPMTVGSAQMMVAGRGMFVDGLISVAGGENAYPAAAEWPTVTPAKVIEMAPDVVIINAVGGDAAPDRVQAIQRAWQQWATVPAVRKARVHILTAPFLTIPGPRVGMAAECLADLIHPDAARQEDTTRSSEP